MSFEILGLKPELLGAVKAQGYIKPTPIQSRAIPVILEGRDILAGAQTGTGKTAAFALPLLQKLSENPIAKKRRRPRALILAPTRELAAQVGESAQAYGRRLSLRITVVYGGVHVIPQINRFQRGVDMVVATPGRLLDHALRYTIDLSRIEFLVLDEADRMLDLGFIHDIQQIIDYLPPERQNLMFSATYSSSIKQLAATLLENPVKIEVARSNATADAVTQYVHPVARSRKRELLSSLIRNGKWKQVLVFTRTKHGANRLTTQLMDDGIKAAAIHSNKNQSTRTRVLGDFKKGVVNVLVATDVAARGLDINRLPHVVNFDLPNIPEDYIHRIGRTGRAGQNGVALSLVCREEQDSLEKIQHLLKQKITVKKITGFQTEMKKTTRKRTGNQRKSKNAEKTTSGRHGKSSPAPGRRSRNNKDIRIKTTKKRRRS